MASRPRRDNNACDPRLTKVKMRFAAIVIMVVFVIIDCARVILSQNLIKKVCIIGDQQRCLPLCEQLRAFAAARAA